jgi:hypothetical protein
MATAQRVTYFKANLEDKPGTLLALAKDLKVKNLGLTGLWGYGTSTGRGDVFVIPKNPEKLRNAWKQAGILVEEGTAFFLKGADKTGALIKSLDAIAQAGVNIIAMNAIAVGGKYGSMVWVAQADVQKAAQALGVK